MAKRKYGMKKMEPAVMTVSLNTGATIAPGAQGTTYADLSQIASLINRRFYRQGINWAVAGMKIICPQNISGTVLISKVPNTWVAFQAYKKAFEAWNRQQMEALEESGGTSAAARFRDFKIHADVGHVTAGFAANMLPLDTQNPAQPYADGEWDASQIVIPHGTGVGGTTVERFLHMVGVNFNASASRGIIEGYADSRAYPQSPDPVSPDLDNNNNWMSKMFDDGETFSDVLDNATDHNDNLPYPQVNYPGGETQAPTLEVHDFVTISQTTIGGQTRVKGGSFPCGLIRFDWLPSATNSDSANIAVQLELVPGTHRGYLCEKMLEV